MLTVHHHEMLRPYTVHPSIFWMHYAEGSLMNWLVMQLELDASPRQHMQACPAYQCALGKGGPVLMQV